MLKKTLLCGALILANGLLEPTFAKDPLIVTQAKDAKITATITGLYAKSPLLKNQHISITTARQHVHLSGRVDTERQYARAITLAGSVKEVRDIDADNMRVKHSNAPLADAATTAKVKGVFLKEKLFGTKNVKYWPVHVETKNGVVYLSGRVDTKTERDNLIKLAKQVSGVKKVDSAISYS